MRQVFFRKWAYNVPETWDELDQRRWLDVIRVMYLENTNVQGILSLFRALAQIPWYQFFLMRTPQLLEAAEETTEFLLKENTMTKNHLPFFKGFAGPADALANVKMGEFCYSEFYYSKYRATKANEDIDRLVAVLYRPRRNRFTYSYKKNPAGDYRMPFNPNTLEYHRLKVAKWPMHVKLAIYHFYEGARNQKIQANPKVFEGGSGEESLYGLWSVMRSVSKAGHFGDFDKVQEQYIDTILMELNETVSEAEKIEAERNKVTKK